MPGAQIALRLKELGYRVQTMADAAGLVAAATGTGALVAFVDLAADEAAANQAILGVRANSATQHLPLIAFCGAGEERLQAAARAAGATLVVSETALLQQLRPLLDQALALD